MDLLYLPIISYFPRQYNPRLSHRLASLRQHPKLNTVQFHRRHLTDRSTGQQSHQHRRSQVVLSQSREDALIGGKDECERKRDAVNVDIRRVGCLERRLE